MRRRAARNQQNQQNVRDDAGLALLRNANEVGVNESNLRVDQNVGAQAADLEIQIPDDLRSNADSLNSEGATIHSDLSGSDDSQSGSAMEDGGADEDDANDSDMDNEEMDELEQLHDRGFLWQTPAGEITESKAILLNCIADSKARPIVQNVKCHNGFWGCDYCYHPGVMYEGSSQAKYPMDDTIYHMIIVSLMMLELLIPKQRLVKIAFDFNTITVSGDARVFPFSEEETEALLQSGHNVTPLSYECMVIQKVMFHSRCYTRKGEKTDSSIVQLKSGQFGAVERIIDPANFRGPTEPTVLVLLCSINVAQQPLVSHHTGAKAEHIVKCCPIVHGNLTVVKAPDIKQLLILMNCGELFLYHYFSKHD
ncbi:hypothetical protein ONE63_003388 [Megalurothrips usitatus]|uniref:Uncharacterized protein n=1 Tax=Megalurothrips usitatus TaxID=439358 RepID=A0AAV7XBD4_9NEOP|nr:hypothetical protein ONE63_003388 [Megalurothrips usitatus]